MHTIDKLKSASLSNGFEEEMLNERGVGDGVIGVGHVITSVDKA